MHHSISPFDCHFIYLSSIAILFHFSPNLCSLYCTAGTSVSHLRWNALFITEWSESSGYLRWGDRNGIFIYPNLQQVRLLSSEPCPECKSVKLPRSELSALWQYTAKHKLGDLSCHDGTNTPYRPAPVTKYDSFLCSNNPRRIDSNEVSGKRVWLFEETPLVNATTQSLFHQPLFKFPRNHLYCSIADLWKKEMMP